MKVVIILGLALIAFTSLVSCAEIDDFTDGMLNFREFFQEKHMEIDNLLRETRWNVSDILNEWNKEILQLTAASVTSVYETKNEIYSLILELASVIGNQNQCLIGLDIENDVAATSAGDDLSQCSQSSNDDLLNVFTSNLFHTIPYTQLLSSEMQIITLEGMGYHYNLMTDRQYILEYLDSHKNYWLASWTTNWLRQFQEELLEVEDLKDTAILSAFSCQSDAITAYNYVADEIRNRISLCTE